jgi:hypothetical protein
MHHSGTSILAEILHRHGVFMHPTMPHYESKFFTRDINDRLIMGGGANWANNPPMSVADVMSKVPIVRARIDKHAYTKYCRAGYDGASRWGFKDPRTCIILPLYLELFPRAQLVHIIRNADDVAASLAASRKAAVGIEPNRAYWKALHQEYVDRAQAFGKTHPQYYELRYEALCRQPIEVMRGVFAYLRGIFDEQVARFLYQRMYTHRIGIGRPEIAQPGHETPSCLQSS